jgi:hypothetical protein
VADDPDVVGWARVDDDEPEELPPPTPPQASLDDYRPLRRRANLARASLVLVALAGVVAVVFDVAERSLLARVGTGEPVTVGELTASDDRQLTIALVQTGLWILTAVFFIAWLHRAYKNLRPLGAELLRFGPGWAIGSWFVPIMNLFRPKQIVNDVWRGSDPALADRVGWIDAPVPFVFTLWWIAYLAAEFVGTVAGRLSLAAESTDDYELSSAFYIAVDSLSVLAALLAVVVVDMTTARQAARVVAAGGDDHPGARARRWLRGGRHAAAAAALGAVAVGAGLLTLAVQPEGSEAAPAAAGDTVVQPPFSAPEGFSFTDDFSDPASGWIEQADDEVSYAYENGEYRISSRTSDLTWFSLLGLEVALDRIQVEVDARLTTPVSDDSGIGLACLVTDMTGYVANIWPDGYYAIQVDPENSEELGLLADGTVPAARGPGADASRIGILCDSGPPSTVTLTLGGRTVAEAQHDEGLGSFKGIAVVVTPGPAGATAYFDNLAVARAGSTP